MSEDRHPRDRLIRTLRLRDATLLVVSSVIGSGIFLTPGTIADLVPHPGWILAAWGVGGFLSLTGALANAELGCMYPRAGGDYVYLREAFHPLAGFLVGWLTFFVIFSGTIATLAVGFAAGLAQLVTLPVPVPVLAIVLVLLTSGLNLAGVRWGALANNVTALLKVGALLAFVCGAPFVAGALVSDRVGFEAGPNHLDGHGSAPQDGVVELALGLVARIRSRSHSAKDEEPYAAVVVRGDLGP